MWLSRIVVAVLVACLGAYKRILSPVLTRAGVRCRFHPTCSEYAVLALKKHGLRRGVLMSLNRLHRCRPDNFESCIDYP
jgi:uncharacterized protein